MNIQQLKEIIFQQKTEFEKKDRGLERISLAQIEKYLKLPHAVVITGVRRCGKSTILAQIMAKHMKYDYYYLNFEDERLIQFSAADDFDPLYQSFLELYGKHQTFFFDEIQNIQGYLCQAWNKRSKSISRDFRFSDVKYFKQNKL
jgi:predicted AAA+ superfamily ATPase